MPRGLKPIQIGPRAKGKGRKGFLLEADPLLTTDEHGSTWINRPGAQEASERAAEMPNQTVSRAEVAEVAEDRS